MRALALYLSIYGAWSPVMERSGLLPKWPQWPEVAAQKWKAKVDSRPVRTWLGGRESFPSRPRHLSRLAASRRSSPRILPLPAAVVVRSALDVSLDHTRLVFFFSLFFFGPRRTQCLRGSPVLL